VTATAATLTVKLEPVLDAAALADSIKGQVADALRALADELSPKAEPERYYAARDKDGDFHVIDRTRSESTFARGARDSRTALATAAALNSGATAREERFWNSSDLTTYAPFTEVSA
jgi:hypothetical protein